MEPIDNIIGQNLCQNYKLGRAMKKNKKDTKNKSCRAVDKAQKNIDQQDFLQVASEMQEGSKVYFYGTLMGITFGGLMAISGFILSVLGLSGSIEWIFEASSFKSRITNASPGILFAVSGVIVLWRYKPVVRSELSADPEKLRHYRSE